MNVVCKTKSGIRGDLWVARAIETEGDSRSKFLFLDDTGKWERGGVYEEYMFSYWRGCKHYTQNISQQVWILERLTAYRGHADEEPTRKLRMPLTQIARRRTLIEKIVGEPSRGRRRRRRR